MGCCRFMSTGGSMGFGGGEEGRTEQDEKKAHEDG
jgi:hypothetical protein